MSYSGRNSSSGRELAVDVFCEPKDTSYVIVHSGAQPSGNCLREAGPFNIKRLGKVHRMKSIKFALLAGAALAVTAAGAQADDLNALKAQIEALNARVAAMKATPSVPAGYQLIAVSEGVQQNVPGLELTARERATYSDKVNAISVLPTADAPAGASITWTGFVRTGLVYSGTERSIDAAIRSNASDPWLDAGSLDISNDDLDVLSRGEIAVSATSDTAVGEVGVKVTLRGNFDGAGNADVEMPTAWGYWAMTPELTLGGGYAVSLGNIGYGMDGACTCHYYSTVGFDPGDTTQMRLNYTAGPVSVAIALEDASVDGSLAEESGDQLGVAGEVKYAGDMLSGEVSGSWRRLNGNYLSGDDSWQVGAGLGFGLSETASVSLAAAMGEGHSGPLSIGDWRGKWWGVSGIVSSHLTDEVHVELGAGYVSRENKDLQFDDGVGLLGNSDYWEAGGGLYYTPVDQLTIGVEASYRDAQINYLQHDMNTLDFDIRVDNDWEDTTVAILSVWRF
jgi:hypothetical protein